MRIWEKTLTVCKAKIRVLHLCVVAAGIVVIHLGVKVCLNADGAIPLSTRLPDEQTEHIFPLVIPTTVETAPVVKDISDIESHENTIDQELLTLLRSSSVNSSQEQEWKVVRMRVTAYCTCPRCCGKFSDGLTANLHKVRQGDVFVAADKKHPFGTEMIIPGYNQERPVEVKDRGRLIKGNRLDVFFNNHKAAKKWGTRHLDVLVKADEG